MDFEKNSVSQSDRPDLDEFLSALGGFLEKPAAPNDPGYLRFLEIFSRSVGASEGHLLRFMGANGLESVISFGMKGDFNEEYNETRAHAGPLPAPLDEAARLREAVAIVDLQKEKGVSPWFMKMMERHGFQSLVAVPLLGQSQTVGVFCAYYHDVCLFDRHTLDHLMMIGRMVGIATERSVQIGQGKPSQQRDEIIDRFLLMTISKPLSKLQIFQLLSTSAADGFQGMVCGPSRRINDRLELSVAAGLGVPASTVSGRFVLSASLEKCVVNGMEGDVIPVFKRDQCGDLKSLMNGDSVKVFCSPITWQKKIQGAVIGWKPADASFETGEVLFLNRLCRLASLALNISTKA